MKITIVMTFLGIFAIFLLAGCDNKNITFTRQSVYEDFKSKFETQDNNANNGKYIKSKGVIIYKAGNSSSSRSDINFGPQDINFNVAN